MTEYTIYKYLKHLSFQNPFSPTMEGIVVVHNDIMIVMLSFFFLFFFLFLYFIYAQNISKNKSNIYNHGHWSYGSVPPRPPKKNWKEKLKEHLSNHKEIYIGAGITLGLIILYYYYGQGSVPPNAGSELVPPSVGPIGPESTPSIITPEVNKSLTANNDYNMSNISTTENSENSLVYTLSNNNYFSLIYKYFLIFGILNKFMAFHPLVETPSLNYLPFIISSNIVDFSLLTLNKYYGSCSVIGQFDQIGFMDSFVKQLTNLKNIVEEFQREANLDELVPLSMDMSFESTGAAYTSFVNYHNIILNILNKKKLNIDIFKIFYYSETLDLPPQVNILFDQIMERISEVQVEYLSSIEGNKKEFRMKVICDLILQILNEEYPECKSINQNHLLVLVFKVLEVTHDNLNCYFDFQFNIIEKKFHFQGFYKLYLVLLNHFKMEQSNFIKFYSYLIFHNCIESSKFIEVTVTIN